jgi:hypothetical protein
VAREARHAVASERSAQGEMGENEVMQNLADSYAFWIFAFGALVVVYLLPTLIGIVRGVDRLALVFLVNLIGGPTGIGWIAAMILAFGPPRLPPGPLRSSDSTGVPTSQGSMSPGSWSAR